MPFQSEKQRRYLWANEPEIARDWTKKYGSRVKKQLGGGIMYPISDLWDQWRQHSTASNLMKDENIKDYHQIGAHDFMQRFPNTPDWLGKGLGTGYQYLSELGRQFIPVNQRNIYTALGKDLRKDKPFEPLGAIVGSISDAFGRAKEESRLGGLGIEGLTEAQQNRYDEFSKNWDPTLKLMFPTAKRKSAQANASKNVHPLAKQIGVLGDEDINLDEFMNERLQERIEKQRRMIEEQLGIDSLPKSNKPLTGLDLAQDNPVFDETTGQWYNKPGGYPIPNPNIPKKMDMYNMPYTADPYSPIAKQASLTGNKAFDITTGNNEYIKRRQGDEKPLGVFPNFFNQPQFNQAQRTSTIPQRWMRGFRNVRGDIGRGLGSIRQGVSNFMGDRFKYRPAVSPAGGYSAAQLNQLNARGGYYSEPARDERFRQQRIGSMLTRAAKGKPIGDIGAVSGGTYIKDSGGNVRFTGRDDAPSVGQQTSGRADTSWRHDPFAKGGLASIWPR